MNFVDVVLIIIVAVILFFAMKGTIKHFKGEGDCCGGSVNTKVKVDDKNLSHYPYTVTVNTQGMKCEGCKTKVENELNAKDGVYAIADYKKNTVKVHMKNELSDDELTRSISSIGYTVVGIVH